MSTHNQHDHAPSTSSSKQTVRYVVLTFILPILLALILVYLALQGSATSNASEDDRAKAVAARLQKVGSVAMGDANRPLKSGEEVFKAQCTACHTAGLVGAPKLGDNAAWAPRISTGYAALLNSALKGKNAMGPQGGGEFNDLEIGRAVVYMANAAGGKLAEPAAPAAATPAAAVASPALAGK